MKKYNEFIFEDYSFDLATKKARFSYSLDGKLKFTEEIIWNIEPVNYDTEILDNALFGLWIMAGISYYKTYLPNKIKIKKGKLNEEQARFFNKTYLLGLAQFFYTNQLDWHDSINFESNTSEQHFVPPSNGEGAISALGGGKDSIVAAEILKESKVDTDLWAVNQAERFENLANKMNLKILSVTRKIDPLLLELNGKDAYNGHVPITAINSFIGVVLAILTGKKSVIWAIESSADEINTSWKGLQVNHQYSKSYEFEKEMANYIKKNIAKDLEHYSILRPLTELRISEIFCKNYIDKYNGLFSSCNANFSLNNNDKLNWCGKCPKCAFVFIVFSPFIKKSNLLGLFNGRNIFADEDMKPIIEELLGISGHKPLECVGEIAETRLAINMAKDTGEYPELNQFDFPTVKYDYKKWSSNSIPKELLENIKSSIFNI